MNYCEGFKHLGPDDRGKPGEKGDFFEKCWTAAHSSKELHEHIDKVVLTHNIWDKKAATTAFCSPPMPPPHPEAVRLSSETVKFVTNNINNHIAVLKRLTTWLSENNQVRCPAKPAWTKVPDPHVDTNFKKKDVRWTSRAEIDEIKKLTTSALALAKLVMVSVKAAITATTVGATAAYSACQAAANIPPPAGVGGWPTATGAWKPAIEAANRLWETAQKAIEKSRIETNKLTHQALMFERGRIVSCMMPLKNPSPDDLNKLYEYGKKLHIKPNLLKEPKEVLSI